MSSLIGTYECKVDTKGRLPLPAGLKKQLEKVMEEGFVLKRSVFQNCLELHPMGEWEKVMNKINKLNRFVAKNNDFIRRFTAGVKIVEADASGRIQIAKDLILFASIDKEVVLSSSVNVIEIWDKQQYEDVINMDGVDFAELAEDVMGKFEEDELS